jgi:hypothetical protein
VEESFVTVFVTYSKTSPLAAEALGRKNKSVNILGLLTADGNSPDYFGNLGKDVLLELEI